MKTIDGSTILSQKAQGYAQYVPLHDTDAALAILPIGSSENPDSPFRFSTYADWAQGKLHPAPLSREAVAKVTVSRRTLGEKRPGPARTKRAQKTPLTRTPRGPEAQRKPLPGKKPDDPQLETSMRYILRKERTPEEVKAEIERMRRYVRGDAALTQELAAGLELSNHLMRESQAGRLPVLYGTPHALEAAQAFYKELTASAKAP